MFVISSRDDKRRRFRIVVSSCDWFGSWLAAVIGSLIVKYGDSHVIIVIKMFSSFDCHVFCVCRNSCTCELVRHNLCVCVCVMRNFMCSENYMRSALMCAAEIVCMQRNSCACGEI